MTVNTVSNTLVEKDSEKEEGDVGSSTATKCVNSAIAVHPADAPQPMSVEVLFLFLIITAASRCSAILPCVDIYDSNNARILL